MRSRTTLLLGTAAAVTGFTAALLPIAASSAAAATVSCSVSYSVSNDWGSGFTAAATITDTGTAAIQPWTLTYTTTGNQTLQSGWNGTWSQSGHTVTVSAPSWSTSIAAGGSVTTNANFGYSGTNSAPTGFAVNGVACGPSSTSTPTTAPPTTAPPTTAPPTTAPPTTAPPTTAPPTTTPPGGSAPALHVSGNKLVNASGSTVTLHGVNRSGAEFACVQGTGLFDGPVDQASVAAMASWHINAVRVPLNEDCWLGESNALVGFSISGRFCRCYSRAYATGNIGACSRSQNHHYGSPVSCPQDL